MPAYMYILRCSDDSYYVGSTTDLARRVYQHNIGQGARYTARRRPVTLVYAEEFEHKGEAYAMEKRVQGWSRAKREALISGDTDGLRELSKRGYRPSENETNSAD